MCVRARAHTKLNFLLKQKNYVTALLYIYWNSSVHITVLSAPVRGPIKMDWNVGKGKDFQKMASLTYV